jgi:hypothetical protein
VCEEVGIRVEPGDLVEVARVQEDAHRTTGTCSRHRSVTRCT